MRDFLLHRSSPANVAGSSRKWWGSRSHPHLPAALLLSVLLSGCRNVGSSNPSLSTESVADRFTAGLLPAPNERGQTENGTSVT